MLRPAATNFGEPKLTVRKIAQYRAMFSTSNFMRRWFPEQRKVEYKKTPS